MRPYIERLVQKANQENVREAHRFIKAKLYTSQSKKKLMREIAPRFQEEGRNSGFTSIEPIGRRKNDSAEMAIIELVGNPI